MPINALIPLESKTPEAEPLGNQYARALGIKNQQQAGQIQQQQLQENDLKIQQQQRQQQDALTISRIWKDNQGDVPKTLAALKASDVSPETQLAMSKSIDDAARAHAENGISTINLQSAREDKLIERLDAFSKLPPDQRASLWPSFVKTQVDEQLITPEQAQQRSQYQGPDTAKQYLSLLNTSKYVHQQALAKIAEDEGRAKVADTESQARLRDAQTDEAKRKNQPPSLPAYQAQIDAILPKGDASLNDLRTSTLARVTQALTVAEADKAIEDAATERRQMRVAAASQPKAADADTVDYWVKQIQNDPTQWNMLNSNKPLQQAVQAGLAKAGTDLNKLTSQSRVMSETAKEILPHIGNVEAEAAQLDKLGLIGPIGGRWRDFVAGRIGAGELAGGNAENAKLIGKFKTDVGLLMTAVARAHGGARGGGSPAMLEHMKELMDAAGKDLPTFQGNLAGVRDWMQGYADMTATGGPRGGAKADPLGIR